MAEQNIYSTDLAALIDTASNSVNRNRSDNSLIWERNGNRRAQIDSALSLRNGLAILNLISFLCFQRKRWPAGKGVGNFLDIPICALGLCLSIVYRQAQFHSITS